MACLEDSLLASAIEALNIEDYWPTFDSNSDIDDDDDSEYSIILYFYEELLTHIIDVYEIDEADLKRCIERLMYNYSRVANGRLPEDLDYNHFSNCLGYLHRYAACHTALVLSVMIRIFHKCPPPAVRRMLALKDELNLMCLGSGPGNDLVGFLSALYGKHYGLTNLNVTVVDRMPGWETVFLETVRKIRLGDCGNVSQVFKDVNVNTSFLHGDLLTPASWSDQLKQSMKKADMMLLTKVLSVVPNSDRLMFLKNIVVPMKPGSILIFIDCPLPAQEFASLQKYFDVIYEACKEKFNFNFEVHRFGYPNITVSRAFVRVCMKKFIVGES